MPIYLKQDGTYYKADAPKDPGDALKPNVSDLISELLSEEPMAAEKMEELLLKARNTLAYLSARGIDKDSEEAKEHIAREMRTVTQKLPTETMNTSVIPNDSQQKRDQA